MSEDGMTSVLMLALLAIAALMCVAMSDAANVLLARARAQGAADAAALAAAQAEWPLASTDETPRDAALRIAQANGAELESCECPLRGDRATVEVSRATQIRMLGTAPRRVNARAEAKMEPSRMFESSRR